MSKACCISLIAVVVAIVLALLPPLAFSQSPRNTIPPSMVVQTWHTDSDNMLYAGTAGGEGVYRSADNGASWGGFGNGLGVKDVLAIVRREAGGDLLAGTWGYGVYRRGASEGSWSAFRQGILGDYGYIRAMAVGLDGAVYAADPDRVVYRLALGASEWDNISANLSAASGSYLRCLAVDGSGRLCAGLDDGVWENIGSAWQKRGVLSSPVYALAVASNGVLWAGCSSGVYSWDDVAWVPDPQAVWDVTALRFGPFDTLTAGLRSGEVRQRLPGGGWGAVTVANKGRVWSLGFGGDGKLYVGGANGWDIATLTYPTPTSTVTATPTTPPTPTTTATPRTEIRLSLVNAPPWSTPVRYGGLITYSVAYGNPGAEAVGGIDLLGWIPEDTTYEPDSATGSGELQTRGERKCIYWYFTSVPGQTPQPTLRYRVRVNWTPMPARTPTVPRVIVNYVEAAWQEPYKGSASSNTVYNGVEQAPPGVFLPYIVK